jgi:hypothetical protein
MVSRGGPLSATIDSHESMHTNPPPEIDESELKAVRRFLTSVRDEERQGRPPRTPPTKGHVPLRHGIARARSRSDAAKDA